MKKILALIFCILIALAQVAYAEEIFMDYDFSDEAQEAFNRRMETPVNTIPNEELKVKKERRSKKDKNQEAMEKPVEVEIYNRTEYTLPEIQPSQTTYQGYIMTIPAGETLAVKLMSSISSGSLDVGDNLTGELAKDWIYNNRTIAPQGSIVYGVVTDVDAAGYAYGCGSLEINFHTIVTPKDTTIEIPTEKIMIYEESARVKNVARDVGVGTVVGVLGGLAWFALSGGDIVSSMAIAGGLGLAGGAVKAASTRGEDAELEAETIIDVILERPVNTALYNPL